MFQILHGLNVDWMGRRHLAYIISGIMLTASLVSLVARDSAVWVACGLVAGIALAMVVSRSMSSLIYGVEPLDWVSLMSASSMLATVAGLAALLPAWRATRVDPMTVLRAE